jgi:hypothetical protein
MNFGRMCNLVLDKMRHLGFDCLEGTWMPDGPVRSATHRHCLRQLGGVKRSLIAR